MEAGVEASLAAREGDHGPTHTHTMRTHLNQYEILKTLGHGTHGKVLLARNMKTREFVAIKSVKRKNKDLDRHGLLVQNARARDPKLSVVNRLQANEKKIRREIAILRRLKHPHVVSLVEVLDDPTKKRVYIVMEYLGGGELEWRTTSHKPTQTVFQSTRIIRDVMLGLRYLHLQGIVHRDIKPANLLLSEDHVTVKISDFGVSVYELPINRKEDEVSASEAEFLELMEDNFLNRVAGTPAFLAPEVCPNQEDHPPDQYSKFAVDTWALGVTYYCLLFGNPPWEENQYWALLNRIASEDFEIPERMGSDQLLTGGRHPSEEYADGIGVLSILDGLLTKDPSKRLTLVGLKQIPYLTRDIQDRHRWMQETAKQAGDVISVTESETQAAIGFVRWRNQLQSSLGKLRFRSSKAKAFNSNPRLIPLANDKPTLSSAFSKGLSLVKGREHDTSAPTTPTEETTQTSKTISQLTDRSSIGMHRKVMDALLRSRNASQDEVPRDPPSPGSGTDPRYRQRRGGKAPRDRQEEFTLQSAGPSHEARYFEDVDQRVVVSEGESVITDSDAQSDGSGYTSSSDDYGETDVDRQQRFFVGAGGILRTRSAHTHPIPHSEIPNHNENPNAENEVEQDFTHDRVASVYTGSGSDSSEEAPVEIRRRRPTISSTREAHSP